MGTIPPAHRRLVPRVPKKVDPEEHDVTAERVIVIEEPSESREIPRMMPQGSVDLADDSLEMTAVRANFIPVIEDGDDGDEMTAQRVISPPPPDEFDDASETSAHMPRLIAPPPHSKKQRETLAHMLAEKAVPQFDDVVAENLVDAPIDANAFSDYEPTSLKAPTSPDAEDRPTTHISPAERGLLAAMSEGHEASRMVYVTWLKRRGEVVRAEFLRLDCTLAKLSPEDPRHAQTKRRMHELAPRISLDWRSRVARSLIEGCTTTTGRCPGYWRALPADADDIRGCGVCGEHVFYCVSIDLARSRATSGQRVAVDLMCDRHHGDLEIIYCTTCREEIPTHTRFCPHCGRAQY